MIAPPQIIDFTQLVAALFEGNDWLDGANVRAAVNAVAPVFGLRPEFFVTYQEAAQS